MNPSLFERKAFAFAAVAALGAQPAAALAGAAPVPAASAAPATANTAIVTSLREIGRVHATTRFCSAIRSNAQPAAETAVAYELTALRTTVDLLRFSNPTSQTQKMQLENRLDGELVQLVDLSRNGRDQLNELRDLAATATPDQRKEILGLRDALDGAKARQYELTKTLAHAVGVLAEKDPPAIVDDNHAKIDMSTRIVGFQSPTRYNAVDPYQPVDNFEGTRAVEPDFISDASDSQLLDAGQRISNILPDDDRIRGDLRNAALHASAALALGDCRSDLAQKLVVPTGSAPAAQQALPEVTHAVPAVAVPAAPVSSPAAIRTTP